MLGTRPLTGVRVLDFTWVRAGPWATRWPGALGAEVIKIEPPGGQHTRRVGPFLHDVPHPERSLSFWHYNTSKRGVTLSLACAEGQDLFRRL